MCCPLLIKQGTQLSCTVTLKLTTFIFHIHRESEPQTNHMHVLIKQCTLSSRTNQSRTSIDQLAEHRKSSAYHFAASWWVFVYQASRPLTPENIPHPKGEG